MAHNPDLIPWSLIADDLEYRGSPPKYESVANLYPMFREGQLKRLRQFGLTFHKTLQEAIARERQKYPTLEAYGSIGLDELIISDETAKKIEPLVKRYRREGRHWARPNFCHLHGPSGMLTHGEDPPTSNCTCNLTLDQRRLRYWTKMMCDCCNEDWQAHNDTLDLFKVLMIKGEMDTIFRICTLEGEGLKDLWQRTYANLERGWSYLVHTTCETYICLNILYHYFRIRRPPPASDYRRTAAYQSMVIFSTGKATEPDTHCFPHRDFLNVGPDTFDHWRGWGDIKSWYDGQIPRYGTVPLSKLRICERPIYDVWNEIEEFHERERRQAKFRAEEDAYRLHATELPQVMEILRKKGLPDELGLMVLKQVEFQRPWRTLLIADDPLHPENQYELEKYLEHCWAILVRCGMVTQVLTLGVLPWPEYAWQSLDRLFVPEGEDILHDLDDADEDTDADADWRSGVRYWDP